MGVWCPDESTYFSTYRHHLLVVQFCENEDYRDVTLSASDSQQMKAYKRKICENGLRLIIRLHIGQMFIVYLMLNLIPNNI